MISMFICDQIFIGTLAFFTNLEGKIELLFLAVSTHALTDEEL